VRTALAAALVGLCVLAAVVAVRTARFTPTAAPVDAPRPLAIAPGAVERLAGAIRIPTVSYDDPARMDRAVFLALHRYLAATYPRVHATLARETVSELSLLYTWPGTDPALPPAVLLAHLDVVPAEPGTTAGWTHPPFDGAVANGFVWGRGTLDDKGSVLAILEAAEALLAAGERPPRTVVIAFGHDEEVGGRNGALAIVAALRARGVAPAFVLDEGMAVVTGGVRGVARPVALVGTAEKGSVSLELAVPSPGGHSSMPPAETGIGVLARALLRLEEHPFPARLDGPGRRLLEAVGPAMALPMRAALANLWLTAPFVERTMLREPGTAALLRTTTAPTMLAGSPKLNVLPVRPHAIVNFRVLPGDTIEGVVAHVRATIADPRVEVTVASEWPGEPSPEAPTDAPPYAALARAIRRVFPDAIVAPSLTVGATDARHWTPLTPHVFRFMPWRISADDAKRVHGVDERLAVDGYETGIRFYAEIMRGVP
jgi:carboxypeptidase PM20D1